jgi:hypothetical protein
MTYSKPEITALAPAIRAIEGGTPKNVQSNPDNAPPRLHNATIGAYEADE